MCVCVYVRMCLYAFVLVNEYVRVSASLRAGREGALNWHSFVVVVVVVVAA